ncbi:DNA damage-repair/toleration protein DRT102 isoform X1 [Physcomitrium patens]|uniref:Cupin type-2 domain-containing protein n=1 Tax=Physcomitrium patens TaxID=3218 RepID=A0A7I4E2A3_PHYPA|nr:DNA damage-repair/toleration protein DRT102-like isoform X1 [Physcomitrium patens]XP_024377131.1 DNA damage-repair/toleration protein DRT102-like isoform X1 [Physcomitrium patens]|eukprot:XP_024377130.1 DNA damage-repair/toleration protein DRT102-like isoform X1 [Physcomitrella patens]
MADEAASEKPRRVVAGADAFGSELKDTLVQYLKEKDIEVVDLGVDKYYSVAVKVASELAKEKKLSSEGPLSRGLLVCGTGVGVSIFANKFAGVYAAPCNSVDEAMNARSINNTNVLTIGAKIASTEEGKKILDAWLETSFKAPCPASDGCPWNNEIEQFLDASIQEMEMISQAALENADVGVTGDEKSISTSPATPPTSVVLLNSLLETMSHAPSPSIYDSPSLHSEARAGVGLGLTEIRAPTSGMEPRAGVREGLASIHAPINSQLSTELSTVEFDEQAPEEKGPKEATNELDEKTKHGCAICALASQREFEDVSIMPGGSWKIVREDPTSAVVRFKAGSIEPAHHHTFGHDLIVMSGNKTVWNLTTKEKFDLKTGDFLYTPAGDLHRVAYHEDTEFFLRWDGHWDIILDEDIETARAALSASSH